MLYVFFFQAEDGIRDKLVTGVQSFSLPISAPCGAGLASLGTPIRWGVSAFRAIPVPLGKEQQLLLTRVRFLIDASDDAGDEGFGARRCSKAPNLPDEERNAVKCRGRVVRRHRCEARDVRGETGGIGSG